MPVLNFNLTSSFISFVGEEKKDAWLMYLYGKCEKGLNSRSFTIHGKTGSWNGYGADVKVIVEKRPARAEAVGIPADMPWVSHSDSRDVVSVHCPDEYQDNLYFEVHIWLPSDAYQRLFDVDWTRQVVGLRVSTPLNLGREKQALDYGVDPDGREIEWHTNDRNYEYLERIQVSFSPSSSQKVCLAEQVQQKVSDTSDPVEPIIAAVERATKSIGELRASVVRVAWVLGVALVISMFVR